MNDDFSYNKAIAELENILRALQSDNCDIDSMVAKTKRASELIKTCRERLIATENELKSVLESLRQTE